MELKTITVTDGPVEDEILAKTVIKLQTSTITYPMKAEKYTKNVS